MKIRNSLIPLLLLIGLVLFQTGCEYDGPTAKFNEPLEETLTPEITNIEPAVEAGGGINKITITGVNFNSDPEKNKVYFSGTNVDILSSSTTSITVRRPNLVNDAAIIKVVNYDLMEVAEISPYRITSVMERYGGFIENLDIAALEADKEGNVYAIMNIPPRTIYKVTPDGEKTAICEFDGTPKDAKMGPNGNLLVMRNNRAIEQIDLTTYEQTEWYKAAKKVSTGDFDANGNFYGGSSRSDLLVVTKDLVESQAGYYIRDEILCIRVYNNAVYVLVEVASPTEENPEIAIWKHPITSANGSLGTRELILDWTKTEMFAMDYEANYFTFTADGVLLLGNSSENPIYMIYPDGTTDIFYKSIIPTSAEKLVWGPGNYMFMVLGGEEATLLKIDMGAPGAPYYGRN